MLGSFAKIQRGQSSTSASLPPPIGGWNARDDFSNMAIDDAVALTNWYPLTGDVMARKGFSLWSTGFASQVESLMIYNSPTTAKMFAASGTAFYDATTTGAIGAAVVSGLTNARWQNLNVATSGGNFMLCVNGSDKLRGYNGSAWYVDGDGAHDITGVDTASCIQINLFKNRVWLVEKNSLKVWYLPTSSIAGAASALNFQGIASMGGYLMAMGTWTIDAGTGVDDYAVFVTSQGQVIVYQGTDPASVSTWSLKGVWNLGSPIGRRCLIKWAGDLLFVGYDGVSPLSGALQSSRVNPRVALSDKIRGAMSDATANYGANFGWEMLVYPKANQLIVNVPVNAGSLQQQYVMNTITGAWCNFTGWYSNCWGLFNDEPFFGGNGFIAKAWDTFGDNSTNINSTAMQAFNYFKSPGINKRWSMMRPVLNVSDVPSVLSGLNVDFSLTAPTSPLSFTPSVYGKWDSSLWDSGMWGSGGLSVSKSWVTVSGIGTCAAPVLQSSINGVELHWMATDIVFERGGIL